MRVDRHFAFVDLSGFTSFVDRRGDEEAVRVLTEFRGAVRTLATERGVRIAKWLGDGCMLVAVDPEPLVALVLDLQARLDVPEFPLQLRGGLAGGPVILLEGDDYTGGPVNLAARLCDAAQTHEVLATQSVARAAPPGAGVEPIGPVEVSGFHVPVPVVRLVRAGAPVAAPT